MIKPKRLTDNATKNERAEATAARVRFEREQSAARAFERGLVDVLPAGPTLTASTEVQEPHKRPVIRHG
jgi:hypothetical protein